MAKQKPTRRGAEFPLWFHKSSGQWCKTIRGTRYHFGTDKDKALDRYVADKDHLLAGKTPPPKGYTVRDLLNAYLDHQCAKVEAHDLKPRSFALDKRTTKRMAKILGKQTKLIHIGVAELEELRASCGGKPTTRANEIGRIRTVLKFAFDIGMIDRPIRLAVLKKPPAKALRLARRERTPRLLEPGQVRAMLEVVEEFPQLRAMILLGVNCGFGNTDCAELGQADLLLNAGWLNWWRPKTAMARRAKLWPETVEAIRTALESRPKPKSPEHCDRVFLTRCGVPWVREALAGEKVLAKDAIGQAFRRLFISLGIKDTSDGLGFYCFRHCFATVADQLGDKDATRMAMGLLSDDVANTFYVEKFADNRLERISEHVHNWLWPPEPEKKQHPKTKRTKRAKASGK